MDIEELYQRLASVRKPTRYYRSSAMMHVDIPQDLKGVSAREILRGAGIGIAETETLIRVQLKLSDAQRRVGENNLDRTYDIFDRPIGRSGM